MKNRKLWKYAIPLLAIVAIALYGYEKTFNAKHRDVAKEESAFALDADEAHYFFASDEQAATKKYLDQVLEVTGTVTEVADQSVVLDQRVQVNFLPMNQAELKKDDVLTIKGRCVGFDELLLQVKIDQATLVLK